MRLLGLLKLLRVLRLLSHKLLRRDVPSGHKEWIHGQRLQRLGCISGWRRILRLQFPLGGVGVGLVRVRRDGLHGGLTERANSGETK